MERPFYQNLPQPLFGLGLVHQTVSFVHEHSPTPTPTPTPTTSLHYCSKLVHRWKLSQTDALTLSPQPPPPPLPSYNYPVLGLAVKKVETTIAITAIIIRRAKSNHDCDGKESSFTPMMCRDVKG